MPRRYAAAALCVNIATALFAGHPQKIPVKPISVAIEPPPTTLGGPAAPRANPPNLAEEWNLADRVRAASVPSPTDSSRRHVAWRRLARGMNTDAETLRDRWAMQGNAGSPVLPLLEPWEVADGLVRGAAGGEAVQLALCVGGGDELLLGAGVVETASGAAYELGAPSDVQIEAWRTDIALPAVDAPQMGWLQGAATAIAAPAALGGLVLAAGVLTHHLQVHVFVI
mmetsp:Transcript_1237/g.2793  ORF Transcript_1237/g.2793 Transcript_1237/m.2793 type:complete len:226 (-) Transcript_1237:25-702(-)